MRDDFAAFILTHGRPDRVRTYDLLRRRGYTGPIWLVVDDKDRSADEYQQRYPGEVLVFSKDKIGVTFDQGDNLDDPQAAITPAYVINRCHPLVPYTRTVETKHATGQPADGSVVVEEHPGAPGRHYPIPTPNQQWETLNHTFQQEIRSRSRTPIYFTGRLANYTYINQDQAISAAITTAAQITAHA